MKKRFFILSFMATAIMMLLSSCTKDDPEINIPKNAVTYDGQTYEIGNGYCVYSEAADVIEFYLNDSSDKSFLNITCKYSEKGKKVDLSQVDQSGEYGRYFWIIPQNACIGEAEMRGSNEEPKLADEGYLTFTHEGSNYSVEVYAVIGGKVFTVQYSGTNAEYAPIG